MGNLWATSSADYGKPMSNLIRWLWDTYEQPHLLIMGNLWATSSAVMGHIWATSACDCGTGHSNLYFKFIILNGWLEFNLSALCFQTYRCFRWVMRTSSMQYGYRKCGNNARVFSQTLAQGNSKTEIRHRNRVRRWVEKIEYRKKHSGQKKIMYRRMICSRAYRHPGVDTPRTVDK